jgi:putative transposase
MADWGFLNGCRYLFHDRDSKFCESFRSILRAAGVEPLALPAHSPNLNAFAERWVRSVKEECLGRLILFSEASLRHVLAEYVEHFLHERNHQGRGNRLLFPRPQDRVGFRVGRVRSRERLGGLLRHYRRAA